MASCYLDKATKTLYVACNYIRLPLSASSIPVDYLAYYVYYTILREGALDITALQLRFREKDVKNIIKHISVDIPGLSEVAFKTVSVADCIRKNELSPALHKAYRSRHSRRPRDRPAVQLPVPEPPEAINIEDNLYQIITDSATHIEFYPGELVTHVCLSDVFYLLSVMDHGRVVLQDGTYSFLLHVRESLYSNVQHLCCWDFYRRDTSVDTLRELAKVRQSTGQFVQKEPVPQPSAPSRSTSVHSSFSSVPSHVGAQSQVPSASMLPGALPAAGAQQALSSRRSDLAGAGRAGQQKIQQAYPMAAPGGVTTQLRPSAQAEARAQSRASHTASYRERKETMLEAVRCLLEELIRLAGIGGISIYDVSAKIVRLCLQYFTNNSAVNLWRAYNLPFPFQTQLAEVLTGKDFVRVGGSGIRVIFVPPYGVWTLADLERETENYPWGISLQEVLPQLRVSMARERWQMEDDFSSKMSEIARRARQVSSVDLATRSRFSPSGLTSSADTARDHAIYKGLSELQEQRRICIMKHEGKSGTEEWFIFKRSGQSFFFDLVSDQLNQSDDLLAVPERFPDLRSRERRAPSAAPTASVASGLSSTMSTVMSTVTRAGHTSTASVFSSPTPSAEAIVQEKARRALLQDAKEVRERLCRRWCFLQDKEAAKITIGKELDIRPLRSREAATRKRKYNRSAGDWQNHHITAKWYEDAHNEQARKLNGGAE